jgi:hypothetical protein
MISRSAIGVDTNLGHGDPSLNAALEGQIGVFASTGMHSFHSHFDLLQHAKEADAVAPGRTARPCFDTVMGGFSKLKNI